MKIEKRQRSERKAINGISGVSINNGGGSQYQNIMSCMASACIDILLHSIKRNSMAK